MFVRLLIFCLCALALFATEQVGADAGPTADARSLFREGQELYRRGDYETAVTRWSAAYELDPRPLLQFNLSQAYGRMGKLVEERAALILFLETASDADPGIEAAASRLAIVERTLARTALIVKVQQADGARIFIDGEDRGLLPRPDPFFVAPGEHRVAIELEGREPFEAHILVPAGEQINVEAKLPPLSGASRPEGFQDETQGPKSLALPIALYSGGGALLLTGAILGGLSLSASSEAPPRGSADADRSRALAIGADVTLAAGAALAVTGLVLHLVQNRGSKEMAIAPSLSPGLLGLSASAQF